MCLELLKKESPDIIILDILMEPMDGWETLLHIRENPVTRFIPVIMFSAKKISPFEAETPHPHIDDYITKPVSPRDLLETIAKVLSRKETCRKNLELWRHAGLDTEEIEEYTRLMATIEVDHGLIANLQQQLGTERRDTPVGEIERTIEMIHSRIQENSILAEEIALRGNSLVTPVAEREITLAEINPEVSRGEPSGEVGHVSQRVIPEEQRTPPATREKQEVAGSIPVETKTTAPALMECRLGMGSPEGADKGGPDHSFNNLTPMSPERDTTAGTILSAVLESHSIPVREPGDSGSADAARSNETTTFNNPPAITRSEHQSGDERDPVPINTVESALPVQFPVLPQEDHGSLHLPMQKVPTQTQEPVVQPSPVTREEQGTRSIRTEQKTKTTSTVHKEKTPEPPKSRDVRKSTTQEKAPSSPGFFSRIISAIMHIFTRSKP